MCDYSLHAVATRPADVAETWVSTNFIRGHGALRALTIHTSLSAFAPGPRSLSEGCPNAGRDAPKERR